MVDALRIEGVSILEMTIKRSDLFIVMPSSAAVFFRTLLSSPMSFHVVIIISWADDYQPACRVITESFKTLTEMKDFVKISVMKWFEDCNVQANTLDEFDKEFSDGPWIDVTVQENPMYPIGAFYFDSEGSYIIDMNAILRDTLPNWSKRRQIMLEEKEEGRG